MNGLFRVYFFEKREETLPLKIGIRPGGTIKLYEKYNKYEVE